MADGYKDLLLTIGAGVAIVLIVNWLTTPKPPQWPSNYGFAGYMESIDNGRL